MQLWNLRDSITTKVANKLVQFPDKYELIGIGNFLKQNYTTINYNQAIWAIIYIHDK